MKFSHNKKRNTAFIFETLVKEFSKAAMYQNLKRKSNVALILKEFFKKDKILKRDLDIYKSFEDTTALSPELIEKLINEAKRQFVELDRKKVFKEQTKAINKINKNLGLSVWDNFVPSYKRIATINQVLTQKLPPKKQVVLETKLSDSLRLQEEKKITFPKVNNLAVKTFIEKFNKEYSPVLSENQCLFLNKYVLSHMDDGMEFKVYLYEEVDRLKMSLTESKNNQKIVEVTKIDKILEKMTSYNHRKLDKKFILEVLQIQALAE